MARRNRILMIALPITLLVAMGAGLNSSIHVRDGEERDGGFTALNGRITIGDDAIVRGHCSSVNGGITVGANSRVDGLSSVNGSVRVGEYTVVRGAAATVNGDVSLERGASADEAGSINGRIKLIAAKVHNDVKTVNGNVMLLQGSTVGRDIIVEERGRGSSHDHRESPLRIELEDGSVVKGDVIVEDEYTRVEVYLRSGSRVMGRIEGAEVIRD